MALKPMKRNRLTEEINKRKNILKKDVFMITSFRPTKDNSVQVEVCQNRVIGGKKKTLLGVLNRSDSRFSSETTLLFDWLTVTPKDFVAAFPEAGVTVEELEEIASQWSADLPTGSDATVYPKLKTITKVVDSVEEEDLTPVIVVSEITHSELVNGEFFKGKNADDKIENTLERGTNVMRTGSGEDDEFIVHPETGDKIYRFTRTEFASEGNKFPDKIIEGKVTMSQFEKAHRQPRRKEQTPEEIAASIIGGDQI